MRACKVLVSQELILDHLFKLEDSEKMCIRTAKTTSEGVEFIIAGDSEILPELREGQTPPLAQIVIGKDMNCRRLAFDKEYRDAN